VNVLVLWLCWGTQVVLYFLTLLSSLVAGVFDMILHYAKVSHNTHPHTREA
jgi:hypothetical protein